MIDTTPNQGCSIHIIECLSSRICHDLVSPIGAIHNGTELLTELGPDGVEDALGLIQHSASQASARLKCFRLAYGQAGLDSNIKFEDIHKTFRDYIGSERLQFQENIANLGAVLDIPKGFMKALLNVLLIAGECLPRGGVVKSDIVGMSDAIITAEGDGANFKPEINDCINNLMSDIDVTPKTVHAYLLGYMLKTYRLKLQIINQDAQAVTFKLSIRD